MQNERYIKAVDRRNNRVVFISEARWEEYRATGWFDRVDGAEYVYMARYSGEFDFFESFHAQKIIEWRKKYNLSR